MKKTFITLAIIGAAALMPMGCSNSFNMGKASEGLGKVLQAATLTDDQMAAYVKESVAYMDKENTVAGPNDPYTVRLNKLTRGVTSADGVPLNFKVYKVADVNAFACPDGSVRVFSALMDIMDDNELMGIIGHEIGHVMKHHSREAFKRELLSSAVKDVVVASNESLAALTDGQLGALTQGLVNARYSQKQEKEADNCGYDFLVANGRNPWGMVMAFEKMEQMEEQSGQQNSYLTKMFSSHPDTQSRIKAMTTRCVKDGYKRP